MCLVLGLHVFTAPLACHLGHDCSPLQTLRAARECCARACCRPACLTPRQPTSPASSLSLPPLPLPPSRLPALQEIRHSALEVLFDILRFHGSAFAQVRYARRQPSLPCPVSGPAPITVLFPQTALYRTPVPVVHHAVVTAWRYTTPHDASSLPHPPPPTHPCPPVLSLLPERHIHDARQSFWVRIFDSVLLPIFDHVRAEVRRAGRALLATATAGVAAAGCSILGTWAWPTVWVYR